MMKRRLVLAATCLAVLAGGAGAASAASSNDGPQSVSTAKKPHQLCVLFYTDGGPVPEHVCLNW
jgi:ABC-type sugar transport system substrate-binding protein